MVLFWPWNEVIRIPQPYYGGSSVLQVLFHVEGSLGLSQPQVLLLVMSNSCI